MPWNVWHTVNFMLFIIWGFLEVLCGIWCRAMWPCRTDGIFSCRLCVAMLAHRLCHLISWDVSGCLENPFPSITQPCAVGTGHTYFGREIASGRRVSSRGSAARVCRWFSSLPPRTHPQQLLPFPWAERGEEMLLSGAPVLLESLFFLTSQTPFLSNLENFAVCTRELELRLSSNGDIAGGSSEALKFKLCFVPCEASKR